MRVLILFFALFFIGCGRSATDRSLELADRLMNERPDSAYALLRTVEYATLSSEAQRAYYGVLMGQAKHKNFVSLADDSLLAHSALYYRDRGAYNYGRARRFGTNRRLCHLGLGSSQYREYRRTDRVIILKAV